MPPSSTAGDMLSRPDCGPVLHVRLARRALHRRRIVLAVDGTPISKLTVKPSLGVRHECVHHEISIPATVAAMRRPAMLTARDRSTGEHLPGSPMPIASPEQPLRHGHVDKIDGAFVLGWATQVPAAVPPRIRVRVENGGEVTAAADSYRRDILDLLDVVRAGFRVVLPPANGAPAAVVVKLGDWVLPGGGVWLPVQQALAGHYRTLALGEGPGGFPTVADVERALACLAAEPAVAEANPLTTSEVAKACLAVALSRGDLAVAARVFASPAIAAGLPILDGRSVEVVRCLADEADGDLLGDLLAYLARLQRPHPLADILALRVELRRASSRGVLAEIGERLTAMGQDVALGTPLRLLAAEGAIRAAARM